MKSNTERTNPGRMIYGLMIGVLLCAPVLSGCPANTTAECSAVPAAASPTATDNCDTTPTVSLSETSTQTSNGTCTDQNYTITRIWTATDNCGNSTTCTQIVSVADNTAALETDRSTARGEQGQGASELAAAIWHQS